VFSFVEKMKHSNSAVFPISMHAVSIFVQMYSLCLGRQEEKWGRTTISSFIFGSIGSSLNPLQVNDYYFNQAGSLVSTVFLRSKIKLLFRVI